MDFWDKDFLAVDPWRGFTIRFKIEPWGDFSLLDFSAFLTAPSALPAGSFLLRNTFYSHLSHIPSLTSFSKWSSLISLHKSSYAVGFSPSGEAVSLIKTTCCSMARMQTVFLISETASYSSPHCSYTMKLYAATEHVSISLLKLEWF